MELSLDGSGTFDVNTGIGFLDHMLSALAKHGRFDLKLACKVVCVACLCARCVCECWRPDLTYGCKNDVVRLSFQQACVVTLTTAFCQFS